MLAVKKRNGKYEDYDLAKLTKSVDNVFTEKGKLNPENNDKVALLIKRADDKIKVIFDNENMSYVDSETIKRVVAYELMKSTFKDVAYTYIKGQA